MRLRRIRRKICQEWTLRPRIRVSFRTGTPKKAETIKSAHIWESESLGFLPLELFLRGMLWVVIKWSIALAKLSSLAKVFWGLPTYFSYFLSFSHPAYWNNDILKIIEWPTFWVASAGTYNRFGHPSFKVFGEISKRKCIPVWCSEINPVIYHFELEYECN